MKKSRNLLIILSSAFVFALFVSCGSGVEQPIQFPHKTHIDAGVECNICHQFYETRKNSGRPTIEVCSNCHFDEPMTSNPEEKRLIEEYIKKNKEVPWKRVYYVPEHVYYPHFRHVINAKIDCEFCHGDIKSQTMSLTKPLKKTKMYFCYNCHKESGISVDCITCHV